MRILKLVFSKLKFMENKNRLQRIDCERSKVGALGFEPRASYTPCKRASRTAPRPDFRWLL
jgi:hypothetical protein